MGRPKRLGLHRSARRARHDHQAADWCVHRRDRISPGRHQREPLRGAESLMALTRGEARKQRRQLLQEIAREHRRNDREKLAELRARIRSVKTRRKEAMRKVVARCRVGRHAAKEGGKARTLAIREEGLALIPKAGNEEKHKARYTCKA